MGLISEFDRLLETSTPLSGLDALIWNNLDAAAKTFDHPWRLGSLTTIETASQSRVVPQSRTVVLRHADVNARLIECHTDARSGKVAQLESGQSGRQACWLFYEHESKIQLRLNGTTHVIDGEEANRAWRATPLRSRAAYLSISTPGVPTDGLQPPQTNDRQTTLAESERGRENFRVIRTRVDNVDVLYLRQSGHVRAKLAYPSDSSTTVNWVIP